jgi:hypothetical protein
MTDALEAVKAEAATTEENTLIKFKFEDHEYEYDQEAIATDSDILEAFEEGKMIVPVKLLLGDAQYSLWKSRGKNGKRTLDEVGKMAEKMFGVTPGE